MGAADSRNISRFLAGLNLPKGTLLNRVNHVDPLLCPKCSGSMRIISFIEDPKIIKKILQHLRLWNAKRKPPPCANPPKADRKHLSSMMSPHRPAWMIRLHFCCFSATSYLIDADYPIDLSRRSSTCWVVLSLCSSNSGVGSSHSEVRS